MLILKLVDVENCQIKILGFGMAARPKIPGSDMTQAPCVWLPCQT